MGIIFFLIIAVILFFIYKKNWKKLVYLLMILVPFLGFIINTIRPYTIFAPLFHDLAIILPLYVLFFLRKNYSTKEFLSLELKIIILLFIGIVILQTINPYNILPFIGRLIGIKVWLFYLPFIAIGFHFLEKASDLLKFCKVISIIAIIPCLIGITQYISSIYFGYEETMNFFYTSEVATGSTQNYAKFFLTPTLTIYRIPSTFVFPTQFSNYLILSLIPVITCIHTSKSFKEKQLYRLILVLIILASMASGIRGMYIYLPLFFIFFYSQRQNLIILIFTALLILILLYNFSINFNLLVHYVLKLNTNYLQFFLEGFNQNEIKDFIGNGVGTSTGAARYVVDSFMLQKSNESFYAKIFYELGIVGLVYFTVFYIFIYKEFNKCSNNYINKDIITFAQSSKAFFLLLLVLGIKSYSVNLFPTNFIFFFLLGIIIKLDYLYRTQVNKDDI